MLYPNGHKVPCRLTNYRKNIHAYIHTYIHTYRQTDRHNIKKRQTDRQTDTDRHTHWSRENVGENTCIYIVWYAVFIDGAKFKEHANCRLARLEVIQREIVELERIKLVFLSGWNDLFLKTYQYRLYHILSCISFRTCASI